MSSDAKVKLSTTIQSLVVSDAQRQADLPMVPFDIWGTRAHVLMLEKTKIVSSVNAAKILSALDQIEQRWQDGSFEIDPGFGAQLTLEKEVIAAAGDEAGLSMHTARSRNDQIMVTELLFLREQVLKVLEVGGAVVEAFLGKAQEYVGVPMPGYTHMQPGKPTAASHWFLAHHDALVRALEGVKTTLQQFDKNPLGSVESFGTSWPIDREFTTKLLGFADVWEVPQDAISNRGVFQLAMLSSFLQVALVISRAATDLMQYSTFEYGYAVFGEDVAQRLHPITGSSVMAQKKNPDAAELLRSTAPQIAGLLQSVTGILSALPTGYNRDSREVKEYASLGCIKIMTALQSLQKVIGSLQFDAKRMQALIEANYSSTTDVADFLSQKTGQPYRRVYKIVGRTVDQLMEKRAPLTQLSAQQLQAQAKELGVEFPCSDSDITEALSLTAALEHRTHVGGTASSITKAMIQKRKSQLLQQQNWIAGRLESISAARKNTLDASLKLQIKGNGQGA